MSKFLRHLAVHEDERVSAVADPAAYHLPWMYGHYALPVAGGGVGKLNVWLVADAEAARAEPAQVLGIADAKQTFDVGRYAGLSPDEKRRYYLDRVHAAVLRAADAFGWDREHFERARARMLDDGLRFSFLWKKPVSSPDRSMKAQGLVEVGPETRASLVFTGRDGGEVGRSLLAVLRPASFNVDMKFVFGDISWRDGRTVVVTQGNGRDAWVCAADGSAEYVFPRAASGDPHGTFELGRMYYEGGLLPIDRGRGLGLIRSAADAGYPHAIRFLARATAQAGGG